MPDDVAQAADAVHAPRAQARLDPDPVAALNDPRAIQILSAELGSLLSARSLAYNEAFTRGGMFLAFLSFSFVALALVTPALPFNREFLLVTAVLLTFDLVVGLTTYGRILGTSYEDYRAVYGMARIRHGYGEIAPIVVPYFTTSMHDDLVGVIVDYGSPPLRGLGAVAYQLTTSAGMTAIIVSMLGGVLALVVALIVGASVPVALGTGAVAALAILVALAAMTIRYYARVQASLQVLFPTPRDGTGQPPD